MYALALVAGFALAAGAAQAATGWVEIGGHAKAGSSVSLAHDLRLLPLPSIDLSLPGLSLGVSSEGSAAGTEEASVSTMSDASAGTGAGAFLPPHVEAALPAAAAAAAGLAGAAVAFEPVRHGLFLLLAPLYSRIRRNDVLDHEVRERIYQKIQTAPGMTIQELTTEAGVGWGTTVYHLARLEKEKLVVSRKFGSNRRYFANGTVAPQNAQAISILRNDVSPAHRFVRPGQPRRGAEGRVREPRHLPAGRKQVPATHAGSLARAERARLAAREVLSGREPRRDDAHDGRRGRPGARCGPRPCLRLVLLRNCAGIDSKRL